MSTNNRDPQAIIPDADAAKPRELHPAPSIVWMLIPVALLALLAFLSR